MISTCKGATMLQEPCPMLVASPLNNQPKKKKNSKQQTPQTPLSAATWRYRTSGQRLCGARGRLEVTGRPNRTLEVQLVGSGGPRLHHCGRGGDRDRGGEVHALDRFGYEGRQIGIERLGWRVRGFIGCGPDKCFFFLTMG